MNTSIEKSIARKLAELLNAFADGKQILYNGNEAIPPFDGNINNYEIADEKDPGKILLPACCKEHYIAAYKQGWRFETINIDGLMIEITVVRGYSKGTIFCMNMTAEEYKLSQLVDVVIPGFMITAEAQRINMHTKLPAHSELVCTNIKDEIKTFTVEHSMLEGNVIIGYWGKDDNKTAMYSREDLLEEAALFAEENEIYIRPIL